MDLRHSINVLGGIAATHELYARGATRAVLAHAVHHGRIVRVRQGWYCLPSTDDELVRAARVGGSLGCVSAARHLGLWVRGMPSLHVVVRHTDARLRTESNMRMRLRSAPGETTVVHWRRQLRRSRRLIGTPLECLLEMAVCVSPERVVAAADCAMRYGMVTRLEWLNAIHPLPVRLAALLAEADGEVESITESVFRFRCRRLGLQLRSQVAIRGVGRVDFVFGTRLVVEVDGFAYHSDPDQFESDRRRDSRLSALGFRVLRFSYRQVFERWHEVRAALLAALGRGDHRE